MSSKKLLLNYFFIFILSLPANATTFVVFGDSRGDDRGVNTTILTKIVNQIIKINPAFCLFTGDMVNGDENVEVSKQQLNHWINIMEPLLKKKNFYITFGGGHDVISEKHEKLVQDLFELPTNGPEDLKELCYSFDYEDIHIVCLYSNMPQDPHRLGEKQLEWLENDLKKANNKNIFVFNHDPAFPVLIHHYKSLDKYPEERDKFWDILVKYNIKAYFCGHEHLYNCRIINGIPQIIIGGAGAPLYRGGGGEFFHYAVVDVGKDTLKISIYDENGILKDTITRDKELVDYINKKILKNKNKVQLKVY